MEPVFRIKGDKDVLADAKVNLEILSDDGTRAVTIYNRGQGYSADVEGALRYHMYLSYKDSLFHAIKVDNLHGKVKGVPLNDIYFKRKDGNILAVYVPFEGNEGNEGFIMQEGSTFFAGNEPADAEKLKQKFTVIHNNK